MGEVYSALDRELDRNVAIKLLPNEFTADEERRVRFRQEAKVVSSLNHPNVITIYEIGENDFGHFLATEFVEGKTLREIISRESLTLSRILRITQQAANALVAAHQEHIVHRDIKPENVMVRRDGIVKVLDFGLAKPVAGFRDTGEKSAESVEEKNKTIPGTVMGSARYMSPEQARGLDVDQRTDIWSLGVVLWEMLVGKPPFDGETTADTLAAVIYREPEQLTDILPNIPGELQRIVRKALQKDRDERYQDIKDLALDIKELLHELEHSNSGNRSSHSISDPRFTENPTIIHSTISTGHRTDGGTVKTIVSAPPPAPPRRRSGIFLAGFAAVAAALIVGLFVYNWSRAEMPLEVNAFARPQMSRISTDGRVALPALSPDGKYVAYLSGDVGSRSLVVRQVATESSVTVVPATNQNIQSITFSPTGDYIYYCLTSNDFSINTLYQVPALGGTPRKLIEDVDSTITFSPDGKQFAFMRHRSDTNEDVIYVANAETLSLDQLLSTKDTEYNFFGAKLAWSPDGNTILAPAGKKQSGFVLSSDVAQISVADRSVRPLNSHPFMFVGNIVWFADGSGYLFSGREEQNGPNQIWRASYPGGHLEQVTNDLNDYLDVSLSADGRSLVTLKSDTVSSLWKYAPGAKQGTQIIGDSRNLEGMLGMATLSDGKLLYTRVEGKESDVWVADKDGKNAKAFLSEPGYTVFPIPTPNGRYVLFNLQKDRSSRIWRSDADGKNLVRLTDDDPDYVDFNPQVTPDSRYVIFQRQVSNRDRFELMRVPVEGGPVEPFYTPADWSVFQPRLSPDGKKIAYTTYDVRTFQKKLMIASVDDGRFGKVENALEYNLINQFTWSPDSRSLTILSSRGGTQNIWRQPLDGSDPVQLTDFHSGKVLNFAWTHDGRELLIARGNTNNDLIMIRDAERSQSGNAPSVAAAARQRPSFNLYTLLFSDLR